MPGNQIYGITFFDAKRFQIDLYTFNEQYELAINESQKMQQQASQMNSNRGSMLPINA